MKPDATTPPSRSVNGSIWLEKNGIRYFGPGPYELLERIAETGSISEAAKQMNLSYKKAWDIINRLNEVEGMPMVATKTGGAKGGGATISKEARLLMKRYAAVRKHFTVFLHKETTAVSK